MNFRAAFPFALIAVIMVCFGIADGNDLVDYLIALAAAAISIGVLVRKPSGAR
jgi:hypothetical protein